MAGITLLEDSTTQSGSSNAASLKIGKRQKVDILVDGSGSGWTVTVEHKDANGTWILLDTFSREGTNNDTIQIETLSKDVRAHFDTDVNRLTIYSKGGPE